LVPGVDRVSEDLLDNVHKPGFALPLSRKIEREQRLQLLGRLVVHYDGTRFRLEWFGGRRRIGGADEGGDERPDRVEKLLLAFKRHV